MTAAKALAALLAVSAVLSSPAPAAPQAAEEAVLDSVEAAVDSGRVDAARETLERWMDDSFAEAPVELRARARILQARLAEDPTEARRAYALVAVEGGPEGARARLRLAQLHLAEGRHERALDELETLRADVPGSPLAAEAWLWTGRVREDTGAGEEACEAYRRASDAAPGAEGPGEEVGRAAEACRRGDGTPDWGDAAPSGVGRTAAADGPEAAGGGRADRGFAVQLGAFAATESAEELRSRAAEAGFDARVTPRGQGDGLVRVRVGAFGTEAAAEEAARTIEGEGFRAIVVEIEPPEDGS